MRWICTHEARAHLVLSAIHDAPEHAGAQRSAIRNHSKSGISGGRLTGRAGERCTVRLMLVVIIMSDCQCPNEIVTVTETSTPRGLNCTQLHSRILVGVPV